MSEARPLQMPKGTRALPHQRGVKFSKKSPKGRRRVRTPSQELSSRQNWEAGTLGSMSQRSTLKAPTSNMKQQGKGSCHETEPGERTQMDERVVKLRKRRVIPTTKFLRNPK